MTPSKDPRTARLWAFTVLAGAGLLAVSLFLASLVVIYFVDEYAVPAWNERSMPPPRPY